MKILHFADAHCGSDMNGPKDTETGLPERLTDFLRSMDRIADYVERESVDLVVFAGDAFKDRNPSPTLEREFARRIRRMAHWAPVILLVGNHDLPGGFGAAHTMDIYTALGVDQVYVVDRPELLTIGTRNGMAQVVGIPWPSRHNIMGREELRGIPAQQIDAMISQAVAEKITVLAMEADPDLPTFLVAHLSIEGGDMGGGTPVGLGGGIELPLEAIALPQFDYVGLGHLHRYQRLQDSGPPVCYSGSIERIDFGEEKEEKGFVVVEIGRRDDDDELFGNGSHVTDEFVPLSTRPFVTVHVETDGRDPTAAVLERIGELDVEDAVVRVIVETTAEGNELLDEAAIYKALNGALQIKPLQKIVERAQRTRLGEMDYRDKSPLELCEAWLASNGTPPEEQERLLKAAAELIGEAAA